MIVHSDSNNNSDITEWTDVLLIFFFDDYVFLQYEVKL